MIDDTLIRGGVIVIGVVLVLRTVFDFMKSRGNGKWPQRIEDLWQWHKPDTRGLQTWKTPELQEVLKVMMAQTGELKDLIAELKSRPCLK